MIKLLLECGDKAPTSTTSNHDKMQCAMCRARGSLREPSSKNKFGAGPERSVRRPTIKETSSAKSEICGDHRGH